MKLFVASALKSGGREHARSRYRKSSKTLTRNSPILTIDRAGWHTSKNLNGIKHYTIRGFNPTGGMVFTTELANRIVDSRAWIYKANETTVTFKAKDYRKVVSCSRLTIQGLSEPSFQIY